MKLISRQIHTQYVTKKLHQKTCIRVQWKRVSYRRWLIFLRSKRIATTIRW